MGITILSFVNVLISLFFLAAGVSIFLVLKDPKLIELLKEKLPVPITKEILLYMGVTYLVCSVLFLISGIGLNLRRKWAHKFTIFLCIVFCFLILIGSLKSPLSILNIIFFLYLGIQIFYLTKKDVLKFFK